jgi:hypothetical protein
LDENSKLKIKLQETIDEYNKLKDELAEVELEVEK